LDIVMLQFIEADDLWLWENNQRLATGQLHGTWSDVGKFVAFFIYFLFLYFFFENYTKSLQKNIVWCKCEECGEFYIRGCYRTSQRAPSSGRLIRLTVPWP
jgi:hypothetical protein